MTLRALAGWWQTAVEGRIGVSDGVGAAVLGEQRGQGHGAEAVGAAQQHLAAGERSVAGIGRSAWGSVSVDPVDRDMRCQAIGVRETV